MLNVLALGVLGFAPPPQQQPPQSLSLRVVMSVKDDQKVKEIFAAGEAEWEARAKSAGFTVVPMEQGKLAVDKSLWEPINLCKAIETLKLLRQISFEEIRNLTELPVPVQKAVLERSNRLVRTANGGTAFDRNSECNIESSPQYTLEIDGRTFSTVMKTAAKSGGPSATKANDRRWEVDEATLARTEEKKTTYALRVSRPISEIRYLKVVQSSNEILAKRWAELRKTFEDLELSTVGGNYGENGGTNVRALVPEAAKNLLALDAQSAGIRREDVAARGRFGQKSGNIVISLKMPGGESNYFSMGIRDLFELP